MYKCYINMTSNYTETIIVLGLFIVFIGILTYVKINMMFEQSKYINSLEDKIYIKIE